MGQKLNFTASEDGWVSEAITPTESKVTINVTVDSDKPEVLAAEHSINGKYWQFCGRREFTDGIEITVNGLREGEQDIRFRLTCKPKTAECV